MASSMNNWRRLYGLHDGLMRISCQLCGQDREVPEGIFPPMHDNEDCKATALQHEQLQQKTQLPLATPAPAPKAESITAEAERIISGARREAYGPVDQSFARNAHAWTGILLHKLVPGASISPAEVALMMATLKVMREVNSHHRDNLVDIIGYTLLREMLHKMEDLQQDGGGMPMGSSKVE